jgi:N-acetylglucosamine kinase-like BadF-type ATPase
MQNAECSARRPSPVIDHRSSIINHQSSIGDQLVLGIDGGGTKTVAWLARCDPTADLSVVGRGSAGPANPQAVGFAEAIENLDRAVAAAFDDAATRGAISRVEDQGPGAGGQETGVSGQETGVSGQWSGVSIQQSAISIQHSSIAATVLALAGSDRDENRRVFKQWAAGRRLAGHFRVVHDALPVLAAGSPDGWGVALIAGTGSLAFGQARDGRTARAGGWGLRFGDEGSGYAIAVAGLRAAAKSADGRGPATRLLQKLLDRLALREPAELIPTISRLGAGPTFGRDPRGVGAPAAVAALADVVTQTADEGDAVAQQIIHEAAGELASMIAAVVGRLDLPAAGFPLVLAGGAVLGSARLQTCLSTHLGSLGLLPDPVAQVPEPVLGALKLAQRGASGEGGGARGEGPAARGESWRVNCSPLSNICYPLSTIHYPLSSLQFKDDSPPHGRTVVGDLLAENRLGVIDGRDVRAVLGNLHAVQSAVDPRGVARNIGAGRHIEHRQPELVGLAAGRPDLAAEEVLGDEFHGGPRQWLTTVGDRAA